MLEIYHIESMSTLDGPGIRTVIFLQGCPLKCAYCHNPDSWRVGEGQMIHHTEIISQILNYRTYYGQTGGVTFSGGEPLLQAGALLELVGELKALGIHVTLDTSGAVFNNEVKKLLGAVDLVILDIKALNDLEYIQLTRKDMQMPMAVLKHLKEIGKDYWIRQVVLKGINDSKETQMKLLELTEGLNRVKVEFLPYHNMGLEKWKDWQMPYRQVFK